MENFKIEELKEFKFQKEFVGELDLVIISKSFQAAMKNSDYQNEWFMIVDKKDMPEEKLLDEDEFECETKDIHIRICEETNTFIIQDEYNRENLDAVRVQTDKESLQNIIDGARSVYDYTNETLYNILDMFFEDYNCPLPETVSF